MDDERRIFVSGASGFLGSWCVKEALDQGFYVNATTRSMEKAKFLEKLEGAKERLKIFADCDLLKPGSFEEAMKGCSTVIHTASPFFFSSDDVAKDKLIQPAVEGTKNVLDSCIKLKVKKVVLTSSTAAVYACYGSKPADHKFSEADWSDEEALLEDKNYYSISKVRAEKLAWEYTKKDDCTFKLAVLNPCLILGPQLDGQTHLNTSCMQVIALFSQEKMKRNCMHIVDVRDCARAHIHASKLSLDSPHWNKRFMLVGDSALPKDMIETLRGSTKVPEDWKTKLPTEEEEELPKARFGAPPPNVTQFDVSRSLNDLALGSYISRQEMFDETIVTCLKNGFDSLEKYDLNK